MIYSIYSKKDATIYEGTAASTDLDTVYQNTGIDEILEIEKLVSSSQTTKTYNSRILCQFDIDWTKINAGSASTAVSNSMYLNLYTTAVSAVPYTYELVTHPISEVWSMGLGRKGHSPKTTDGVSWKNRTGDETTGTLWTTASVGLPNPWPNDSSGNDISTGSNGPSNTGGGVWFTGSFATQSFTHENSDFRMDVSNIALDWSSSEYPNNGFIVKRSGSQGVYKAEADSLSYGSHKFFSENTHTIYPPRLEICWDDMKYVTGSLAALDMSDTGAVFFYLKNNRGYYKRGGKIKFDVNGRLKYPVKTYGTTSAELDVQYVNSYKLQYSIIDCKTNEAIIPYDGRYTMVSIGATEGNYFEIYSDSLFEERNYKIQLRYRPATTSTDYSYYDIKDTFKVVR